MHKFTLTALGLSLTLSTPLQGANVASDFLQSFNVFTGDYVFGRETEGTVFVYGDYSPLPGNHNISFNGGSVSDDQENVLYLNNGRSATSTGVTRLLSGSAVSRVAVPSGSILLNGNGAGDPLLSTGETAFSNAVSSLGISNHSTANGLVGLLGDISSQWSGITSNSSVTRPGGNSLSFNPTQGSGLSVFDITASDFTGAGSLNINFPTGGTVLINVAGTDVTVNGNFTGGFTNNESQILFNFFEAETLRVNSNFRGNILAPSANVLQGGSNIDGGVYSAGLDQSAEVHDLRFEGVIPFVETTNVPEPSSFLLLSLGVLGLLKRRRD